MGGFIILVMIGAAITCAYSRPVRRRVFGASTAPSTI
jgi:hypothetical protein